MKGIEIEISNQSDVILTSIAREKKRDVQKIIDDLSSCSVDYSLIRVLFRSSQFSDELRFKQQISISIFQFFIFFNLLEIMINSMNIKIDLKKVKYLTNKEIDTTS